MPNTSARVAVLRVQPNSRCRTSRRLQIARRQLGPAERAGLVEDHRADVLLRLPHLEHGAGRILQHRHAAGIHHVEGRREHFRAERLRLLRRSSTFFTVTYCSSAAARPSASPRPHRVGRRDRRPRIWNIE
jgi:hypothetical protein